MVDYTPDPVQAPSLFAQAVASLLRSWLNAAAGALGTAGVLQPDQQTQFVTVALALLMWAANYSWSWLQKRDAARRLKVAIASPSPAEISNAQGKS